MSSENKEPLVGKELLKKVKKMGDLPREDKAIECGYYTLADNGQKRVSMVKFLNALIEAEGISLDSDNTSDNKGRRGRTANFRINVQSNGNLSIGKAYTERMNLQPGDQFEVILGRRKIDLQQIN